MIRPLRNLWRENKAFRYSLMVIGILLLVMLKKCDKNTSKSQIQSQIPPTAVKHPPLTTILPTSPPTIGHGVGTINFIADPSFKNNKDTVEYVVWIIDENQSTVDELHEKVANIIKQMPKSRISTNFFTNSFSGSNIFDRVLNGDPKTIDQLDLFKYCDYVILGRLLSRYKDEKERPELKFAYIGLTIKLISSKISNVIPLMHIQESGSADDEESAKFQVINEIMANREIWDKFSTKITSSYSVGSVSNPKIRSKPNNRKKWYESIIHFFSRVKDKLTI